MSNKSDYTSEEWLLLKETPVVAGVAIMVAGGDGHSTVKERSSLMKALALGAQDYPQHELIRALLVEDEWGAAMESHLNAYGTKAPEELAELAVEKCRQVADILAQKAGTDETQPYKQWVFAVSRVVANASKEGSFLGIGGQRISAEEQALLDRLSASLGA